MERAIRRQPRIHSFLYVYRNDTAEFWWSAIPYVDPAGRRRQRRRSFRDHRYGSKNQALRAAQHWRNEQIKHPEVRAAMGDRRPLVLYACENLQGRHPGENPFGLVGVTATFRERPLGGNFSVTA